MEQSSVFRKKSIDRISSPEQLNDYIRVSSPGIWLLLAAVIIFLVGVGVWAAFGQITSTVTVCAVSDGESTVCYIREADKEVCREGMKVNADGKEAVLGALSATPVIVDDSFEDYALHVGNLIKGEWVYTAPLSVTLPDGIYSAKIITESINPLSFIFN